MGTGYTRTNTSDIQADEVVKSAPLNAELNAVVNAFAASTGHTHDGTTAEGGPITSLLGMNITIGDGTADTDVTITFDGQTNDGVLKWMEDEDYFEFSDDILVASTEKLQFRDTAIYINSSTDGQLDLVADTEIQIAATTVDINGNVDVSGTLTVGVAKWSTNMKMTEYNQGENMSKEEYVERLKNSREALWSANPDYVIDGLNQLPTIIKHINSESEN